MLSSKQGGIFQERSELLEEETIRTAQWRI